MDGMDGDVDFAALDAVPLEHLAAELTEFSAHLSAAECRWLLLVAEFDRREAYLEWGCWNCAAWLAWQCGLAPRAARERVRVARALETLPLVTAEFAKGHLSYSKVRALTRIATPENEEDLVGVALSANASHLERIAGAYRRALADHDGVETHQRRYLRCEYDDDGTVIVNGRLSPEQGALLMKALEIAVEHTKEDPDAKYGASHADALALIAESFLASGPAARTGGDRFQVVLNFDAEVLAFGTDGACEIDNGPPLDPETARRLSCDASIVVTERGSAGEVLNIGRKTRSIPPAIRRALRARDGKCRWLGCDETNWLDAHHGRHWAHGGETSLANTVLLCWHHHWLAHEGGWTLEILPDGSLAIYRPDGQPLDAPSVPEVPAGAPGIAARNRNLDLHIDRTTLLPDWHGDRLDLGHAITALLCIDRPGFAELDPAQRAQAA